MKQNKLRALVIVSDIHAGSTEAILPPDFVTEKKQPIGQTVAQGWLWNCWQEGHAWLADLLAPRSYAVVINGDCTEGNHHKTTEIWSPDTRNHVKAAKELLAPVARRAAKTFMVRGTECHTAGSENSVAEAIGAEVNPEFDQPYWDSLSLDVCGVRVSVRHHFPATVRSYLEASQFSIQLGNAVNEAVRSGDVAPRIVVGAHRHRTGHFSDGNRLVVVTGAWQGLTRHGYKIVPDGRPCPSIYVLDWRERDDGDLPAVHYRKWNPAPARAVAI